MVSSLPLSQKIISEWEGQPLQQTKKPKAKYHRYETENRQEQL